MKKIAILGGGIAGLTAAWELTNTPELRSQHKVTVYQMGFRLGGKLASGRLGPEAKNVEHGLHVWFGFYENAFGLLRGLYKEWQKDPRGRFQTWTQVMEPRSYTPIGYRHNGRWDLYPQLWFENGEEPGDGRVDLTLYGVMTELLSALDGILFHPFTRVERGLDLPLPRFLHELYEGALTWLDDHGPDEIGTPRWLLGARRVLAEIRARMEAQAGKFAGEHPKAMCWVLERVAKLVHHQIRRHEHGEAEVLFDWLLADYLITILRGLLNPEYGILVHGDLDCVNHLEFTDFMRANGASDVLLESTFIRVIYETAFQYIGGSLARPNVEAGTCLRTIFRMIFTYKGAMLWEVKGGMGDVLIAPLYETLKARGVEFRFFSRVQQLKLSADKKRIAAVDVGVQAKLARAYEPLITLDYGPVWPDEPRWEYLVDGERLKHAHVNFESKWEKEPLVGVETLELGRDFDHVVLAMALGAIKPLNEEPSCCAELIAENPRFSRMVNALGLVPSQALQVWLNHDLGELEFDYQRKGCEGMLPAAVDGPDPFGIWADMTPVLATEQWRGNPPRSVHYLCGVLETDLYKEPSSSHDVPRRAFELVRGNAQRWLESYAGLFWPRACLPGTWTLDWNALADPAQREGPERLDAQFVRANIDPTECCVGTTVGTSQLRLGAAESGFENLTLAGAWTKTPMNVECVEGAVMSGMLASRAICGLPRVVVGEHWLRAGEPRPLPQRPGPRRTTRKRTKKKTHKKRKAQVVALRKPQVQGLPSTPPPKPKREPMAAE